MTDSDRVMNKALDTIEYQVDNIILQLDSIAINDVKSISYRFDTEIYRWSIDTIIDSNKQAFKYVNDKWLKV